VPTAGATVITGVQIVDDYTRRLVLNPPADWASHDGACEVVDLIHGNAAPITCSATSVEVFVDIGMNRFAIRAHASDNSRSVDSAARSVRVIDPEPTCGPVRCFRANNLVEISPASKSTPIGPAGAGLGFLALAALLRIGGRRRGSGQDETR
jgi:hypothetical protein